MTQVNLTTANEFIARHIGPRAGDEQAMLNSLGFDSLEALSASVIPDSIKGTSVLGLEDGLSEADALALIKSIATKTSCSRPSSARVTTAPTRRRRSCATSWKTRPGTPPTPHTSQKSPRAVSKRC